MKIAIVSKLWEETSYRSLGGTGVSIGYLVDGLVERGHNVTLFATGNSKTKAQKLVFVKERPYKNDYSEIREYRNIAEAFSRHREFDIIHCAVEHKSVVFGDLTNTPSLHSIRYGEFFEDELALLKRYKNLNFMGNSKALKKSFPFLNWKGFVYNGVDVAVFPFSKKHNEYMLYIGRISPQKGIDIAIDVAKKLNKKLILRGKIVETDREYLEKKIFPFIDGKQIIYDGEVGFKEKIRLLKNAQVLIHPVNYFEACANTIIEAMASGVPVVAFDKGSNSELIKDGKTGFVVKTKAQMIKAVRNIDKIERIDCRKRVEKYFTKDKMAEGYEKLYKKIIKDKKNGKKK